MQPQKFLKKVFGTPSTPDIPDPKEAPDPDDLAAKRKAQREMRRKRRGGRASTILSESNTLG